MPRGKSKKKMLLADRLLMIFPGCCSVSRKPAIGLSESHTSHYQKQLLTNTSFKCY